MANTKDIPQTPMYPYPSYLKEYGQNIVNFGLYFQKYSIYNKKLIEGEERLETIANWDNGKKGREKRMYEWGLVEEQAKHFDKLIKRSQDDIDNYIYNKHQQQTRWLENYVEIGKEDNIFQLSAKLNSRLITGIGETTPTEVGMVFDHNSGMPYIPAASVKGAVRYAYCVNYARESGKEYLEEDDVKGLKELFGSLDTSNSSRGGFVFMDAYSTEAPDIVVDIMNPHHTKYYNGEHKDGPVETEPPVPIKFLAVEKGLNFTFRGFFINDEAKEYKEKLEEAFNTALTELGIGAKTAVGYGRFEEFTDTTKSITDDIEQKKEAERKAREEKEKAEREKREKEEAERLRKQAIEEKKRQEEEAFKNATGIDKDIMILRREETKEKARELYDRYLATLEELPDEKHTELAKEIWKFLKTYKKKKQKPNYKIYEKLSGWLGYN